MDNYIREEILSPMGITDVTWTLDQAGNPHGMAGLQIRAVDLAKIGQMMLDGGTWRGRQIVSGDWVRLSTAQPAQPHDPTCGLLWWLIRGPEICMIDDAMIADLKAEGLTEDSLKKIESLKGKEYDLEGVWAALRPIVHKDKVASRKLKELDDRIRRQAVRNPSGYALVRSTASRPRDIEGNNWSFSRDFGSSPSASSGPQRQIRSRPTISPNSLTWSEIWRRPIRRRLFDPLRSRADFQDLLAAPAEP